MSGKMISFMPSFALPVFILIVVLHAMVNRVNVYEAFVDGAKQGFDVAIKLVPYLIGIFMAIGIFTNSGSLDMSVKAVTPGLNALSIPKEIIPLMLVRPLSGSAAIGLTMDVFQRYGPDSYVGRLASTICGSTDTTFYILAVYFASVGIKKTRHSLLVGLLADLAGFAGSVYICSRIFSSGT